VSTSGGRWAVNYRSDLSRYGWNNDCEFHGASHHPERWIDNDWVRPGRQAGTYAFCDIDVERIRLIPAPSHGMQIDEDALLVVLMLLDQLYDLRRRMHALGKAKKSARRGGPWHDT
jgi:hypothetical protein